MKVVREANLRSGLHSSKRWEQTPSAVEFFIQLTGQAGSRQPAGSIIEGQFALSPYARGASSYETYSKPTPEDVLRNDD